MDAQTQSNTQSTQAASQAKVQEEQAKTATAIELETAKNGLKIEYMKQEAAMKTKLMDHEFEINMKLRGIDNDAAKSKEAQKDDRKDERTKIQASQQSQLIDQKKNETTPKNFESSGNDSLATGMGVAGLTTN